MDEILIATERWYDFSLFRKIRSIPSLSRIKSLDIIYALGEILLVTSEFWLHCRSITANEKQEKINRGV